MLGGWRYEGGGALHSNTGIFDWNKGLIEGLDVHRPEDPHSRPVAHRPYLPAIAEALYMPAGQGALLIQNTNPVSASRRTRRW